MRRQSPMPQSLSELAFPAQYLEVFGAFLQERGIRPDQAFHQCGLGAGLAAEPGAVISGDQLLRMLRMCRRAADPARPLSAQLLEHFPVTAHGTLGIVVLTSPNLEAALEAALRFYPLVMPAYDIRREEMGDRVHLVVRPLYDLEDVADDLTETILGAFNSIRRYVNPGTRLLEIHLPHARRFPLESYGAFADPDMIFFDRPCAQLLIPKRHLSFSLTTSNRPTMEQFRQQLEQQAARLADSRTCRSRVRQKLAQALRANRSIRVEATAAALNMSTRTLARRLQEESVTFKELANEARIDYAEFLLLNSVRSVSQVAYAAGFTNESSFARAFRKRKGVSPSGLRRGRDVSLFPS